MFVYLRLSNETDNIRYKKIDVGIYMDIHTHTYRLNAHTVYTQSTVFSSSYYG